MDAQSYLSQINELHTLYQIDKSRLNYINIQKNLYYWSLSVILVIVVLIIIAIFRNQRTNNRLLQSQQEQGKSQETSRKVYPTPKAFFISNMTMRFVLQLNALSGFSAILTEESIDNETKQQCNDIIQQNSELLLKLINDVIDLSSLEIGKMQFKFNECDIVALCRNVIDMVEKIKQTQAEVRFSTSLSSLKLTTDSAACNKY